MKKVEDCSVAFSSQATTWPDKVQKAFFCSEVPLRDRQQIIQNAGKWGGRTDLDLNQPLIHRSANAVEDQMRNAFISKGEFKVFRRKRSDDDLVTVDDVPISLNDLDDSFLEVLDAEMMQKDALGRPEALETFNDWINLEKKVIHARQVYDVAKTSCDEHPTDKVYENVAKRQRCRLDHLIGEYNKSSKELFGKDGAALIAFDMPPIHGGAALSA